MSLFCHWDLCEAQITAIARGKAHRTQLTTNCFICRLLPGRQAIQTNNPDCCGGLHDPLVTTASPPQHPSREMMRCMFVFYFICISAHSDRELSAVWAGVIFHWHPWRKSWLDSELPGFFFFFPDV